MSFCWFTGFIGYPNFFKKSGHSHELAKAFLTLAKASLSGKSYKEAKDLFPGLDHAQVETKKAAFQEFGLLYVVPRSNTVNITPLGLQIQDLCSDPLTLEKNRRTMLLALCNALATYQFNNPLPVGGLKGAKRAASTDILPYLATYYLMWRLGGYITVSELNGAVFGLQKMADLGTIEDRISQQRISGIPFTPLASLPSNKGTAENLKIYFVSHLSLDNEIMVSTRAAIYGTSEQVFELTQFGFEIATSVLSHHWPNWKDAKSPIPTGKSYPSIESYFNEGIGRTLTKSFFKKDTSIVTKARVRISAGVLDDEDIENLKDLPKREFEEGRRRLVRHTRFEKIRNPGLVRVAKRAFKRRNGKLYCEICLFDFEAKYGSRGKGYIEAHHKTPIAELEEVKVLTTDDLRMVCSNCHRMLHRPPWISVEELQRTVAPH